MNEVVSEFAKFGFGGLLSGLLVFWLTQRVEARLKGVENATDDATRAGMIQVQAIGRLDAITKDQASIIEEHVKQRQSRTDNGK